MLSLSGLWDEKPCVFTFFSPFGLQSSNPLHDESFRICDIFYSAIDMHISMHMLAYRCRSRSPP